MSTRLAIPLAMMGAALVSCTRAPQVNAVVEEQPMSTRTYSKPPAEEIRAKLNALQFQVTQHEGTEPPFQNAYWDNHDAGLYVDVVTGEPLFSSADKFDSGTGWPSFTRAIEEGRVDSRKDVTHGMVRVEARSRVADSHLGHIFDDGPAPTGQRFCINSASLRFIPVAKLADEGYGAYARFFEGTAAPIPANDQNTCTTPAPGEAPGCASTLEVAILAGGCFWGMENILRKIPGVLDTEVGYEGGTTTSPTYDDVKTGSTGYAEAVRVTFDPEKLSYADLLEKWFFKMHDPTTLNRQENDVGTQYRSAIFVASPEQKKVAAEVKARVDKSGAWKSPVVTEIVDAAPFTRAEDEHQDYLEKHPDGYNCHYLR